jgi:hypothetical protein
MHQPGHGTLAALMTFDTKGNAEAWLSAERVVIAANA